MIARATIKRRDDAMKVLIRTAALLLLAGSLVFPGVGMVQAGELCPMGGTMVMVAVDKDKAVEWLEDGRRAFLLNEDGDDWLLKTVSDSSDKIAIVLGAGHVYFGVADDRDDREADERRMSKAFGNENRLLTTAVQKEIRALWKAGAIDIDGGDVQAIAEASGIGVVSGERQDWTLETADCEPMTVNLDDLD